VKVKRKDQKIRVLITGVGGGGNGEQMIKALRLAQTKYYIVGTDISPLSSGLYQVDEGYTVPPAYDNNYIQTIIDLCRHLSIHVLITGSEPELEVVSANRRVFQEEGIVPLLNSSEIISMCMDKWKTYEFLRDKGFSVPQSMLVNTIAEIKDIKNDMFPLVIKPISGGGGSRHSYIAQGVDELRFFCNYILKDGLKPIIQEYIGTPDSEFTVGVLHTLNGIFVNSIAVKRNLSSGLSVRLKVKNRTNKLYLSPTLIISSGYSQGFIDKFPEVCGVCEEIATALRSEGPLNIQCRYFNGKVYVFEINPRLSGTTPLRAMVGFNEPDILIRHHLWGVPVESRFLYDSGNIMRGLSEVHIPEHAKKRPYLS
jgi:carbamoyl-phosphate synthase large subunit